MRPRVILLRYRQTGGGGGEQGTRVALGDQTAHGIFFSNEKHIFPSGHSAISAEESSEGTE